MQRVRSHHNHIVDTEPDNDDYKVNEIFRKPKSQALRLLWRFMGKALPMASAMSMTLMMIACSLMGFLTPETTILEDENQHFVQNFQWTQTIDPPGGEGFQADYWKPDTTGALWAIDFSPDGTKIAGVDINEKRVSVWNISDGRLVFYSPHPDPLVDVIWLDSEHLMIADSDDDLVVFEVIDRGESWPLNSTNAHQMTWSKGFTGSENGFLWGMDLSEDGSRVVICGGIDNPNIPGEIVTVETSYLLGGNGNPNSIYTTHMPTDCSLSPNGSVVATTLRNFQNNLNQDKVAAHSIPDLEPLWERAIGGSEATAWAIDWDINGLGYTVGWNRPNEGVVTHFNHIDGQVDWYSPIPQNISSISWTQSGDKLLVGLHDPGRMMFVDQVGTILNDVGWHSFVNAGEGIPADVLDVSASVSGLTASSGRDGTIEIWSEDASGISFHSKLGTRLTREISLAPNRDLLAMADSGGVVTVWDLDSGMRNRQCSHPQFGEPTDSIPFAKSVDWTNDDKVIIGYSDGTIVACDEQNKNIWTIDLNSMTTVSVFGRARINMHGQIIATYGEDPNTMVMSLAGNGHVGIGTNSPTEKLHVVGNLKVVGNISSVSGGASIGDSAADTFRTTGHTYLATVDNNVGIGTTSPTTKLDVDGTVSYKHTTFSTLGPTDNVDVSDTTVLEVDTSSNNVTIGGFTGGVQGQIIHVVKIDTTGRLQLEHNETPTSGTSQKIYVTSGADELIVGYGGWTLYCNGTAWFSLGNPTGAADGG